MTWKSWSRTWVTTRRTTTTSRKPQRCSSKIVRWNSNVLASASRWRGQSRTTKTYFCQLMHKRIVPIGERTWTDIEPQDYSSIDYSSVEATDQPSSSWKSTQRRRWSIWILENQRLSSETFCAFSTMVWWRVAEASWQKEEETRKRFQYCTDSSGIMQSYWSCSTGQCYSEQNSCSTFITLDVQINLHPIINSGLIPGGQNLNKRPTVFFLPVDPMDKTT